ncbi:MAG TPA: GGDEF domain-containing protein [Spirochaetota bacterium]|nr:GGDEF domain-containing protein [Spirochaetota bacterium]
MINRILQTKETIELDILSDFNDDTVLTFVIESLRHETDSPYSVLLETIFHYTTSEDRAKSLWDSITENRKELSRSLGRPVSLKTAVVDHFSTTGMEVAVFIKDSMAGIIEAATHDGLTGVFTHEYIDNDLNREFQRARRYSLPLSVLFIDIDNFKRFNDIYGHKVGDRVLAMVGSTLRKCIRKIDSVGRYGGEEFLVVLPHTARQNAMKIARKISRELREITAKGSDLPEGITVSIGVAGLDQSMKDCFVLLDLADRAMYKAKLQGKDRCCAG